MSAVLGLETARRGARATPRRRWRSFRKNWLSLTALGILLALIFVALTAPLIAPYDPLAMTPANAFQAPSIAHPFGTDEFGRDILSRVIHATRVSVGTAAAVVLVAGAVGIPLGLVAGYFGGLVDVVIMRVIDTILAFPAILLAMGLIAVLGQGVVNSAIAVIIVSIPTFARLIRATILQQKALEYVDAARVVGASDLRIMTRTLLPNALPPALVQIAINATWAVQIEAGLSFLGLGVKPPDPSWGQMLNVSRDYLYRAPWYGLFPGVGLLLLVLSLNVLADALQRALARGRLG
jgi:peptide/nickel transport system permease protein